MNQTWTFSECLDKVEMIFQLHCAFFSGSRALFMESANTLFSKKKFKIKSHGTIHTFKNYFVTVFLVFSNKRCGRNEFFPNQVLFALGWAGSILAPTWTDLLNPTSGRDAFHPCLINIWPKEWCTIGCTRRSA